MKRKNWVSILCGGFLLLAVASPVTAAGWDLPQPRPAVLEMVMDWFSGWLPGSEVGSRVGAGEKGGGEPSEQVVASSCEACSECDIDPCIDPDG